MNCHELQEVMSRSVDGGLPSKERREVALHLAGCEECMALINDDKFWDDALLDLFEKQAPESLRSEILGDLDGQSGLSGLSGKKQLKLMAWGAQRKKMTTWDWVFLIAVFVGLVWVLPNVLNK